MNDLAKLQARTAAWHKNRFPSAKATQVALKLAEETGEVASAVLGDEGSNSATGGGDVAGEAADVMIVLMVLLGRFYAEVDLELEVKKKLAILENPNSGHRAAAIA